MFVIAEIGKNFVTTEKPETEEVLLQRIKELVRKAKESGADAVKFQTHCVEDELLPDIKITSPHFPGTDRYTWIKRNSYPLKFWKEVKKICKSEDIEFFSTPMSRNAAKLLTKVAKPHGVKRWKVGSGDISDFLLLAYLKQTKLPVIISSGMHSLEELKNAYNFLKDTNEVSVLHCVSEYPCPLENLNLKVITEYKKIFPIVGLSDHSLDIRVPLAAQKLGAEIIEKHFTLDRKDWGADHKVSLEPEEFKEMTKLLKDNAYLPNGFTETVEGLGSKYIHTEEMPIRKVFKKRLVSSRIIPAGSEIDIDDLIAIRGLNDASTQGIEADHIMQVLGKKVKEDIQIHKPILDILLK